MMKRILMVIVLVAFAVCAVAVAQQRSVIDEARIGKVEVKRTHSHVMNPARALAIPWHVNYQGYLTDDAGTPINDTLSMTFGIWDDPGVGSELWNESGNVVVEEGLFNVVLGTTTPIPSDVFGAGLSRWLELTVELQTLSPRTEITSVGYAYRAVKADSADDAGTVDGFDASATPGAGDLFPLSAGDAQYVNEGQTDAVTSDMIVDGTIVRGDAEAAFKAPYADTADYAFAAPVASDGDWTIAGSVLHPSADYGLSMRSSNTLYGDSTHTHVNLGIASVTGVSGMNWGYMTVGGGYQNTATDDYSTVGGGLNNTAGDYLATIGGGRDNLASLGAFVGGGQENAAMANHSTVGGGYADTASAVYGAVLSGRHNIAGDEPEDTAAVVAGGWDNSAAAVYSSVGGGFGNTASGSGATVAGGAFNTAADTAATVGGGGSNTASGSAATVAGGAFNTAGSPGATVSGGGYNSATSYGASIAGGGYNGASGMYATVGGGYADTAAGDYSFAAGNLVRVAGAADYTFAFGRDFTTSTPNAVVFHNSVDPISVGIGTASPTERLDVDGTVQMTGFSLPTGATSGYVLTSDASGQGAWQAAAGDNDWTITGSVLHPGADYGLSMRSSNVLYGINDSTHVNLGIACTTGMSGQNYKYCTVSGGLNNSAGDWYATVGGGAGNVASDWYATVAGGQNNTASGNRGTVGGGEDNAASDLFTTVGGGNSNTANNQYTTIAGGRENTTSGDYATVGGGWGNSVSGSNTTVAGGYQNTASWDFATVGGGYRNSAGIVGATVSGGYADTVNALYGGVLSGYNNLAGDVSTDTGAVVAGGWGNSATGKYSFVGGGQTNTASGRYPTVSGGRMNTADDFYATVGGGDNNTASGQWATVGGGESNTATEWRTTVAGGENNTASTEWATVGGGAQNTASGFYATVAGGDSNTASSWYAAVAGGRSNHASGWGAAVAGGYADTVAGDHSFAAGYKVRLTGAADYTFAFGREFTTSTPNAVIFHNSVNATKVGIGTTSPTATLDMNGWTGYDQLRMRTSYTPTGTADANGNVGDIAWDDDYVYVKTSAGWKRSALSTW